MDGNVDLSAWSLWGDLHSNAFSGRGGYAFPLYDRRPAVNAANVSSDLVSSLSTAYGQPVHAADVFDAILCLLSAASYTLRFAEDLEDVFPHVPFPAQHRIFQDVVRIGREIRAVEIFERPPANRYQQPNLETQPSGLLHPGEFVDGAIALCADGSGRLTRIPESVWNFTVSGYRVLPQWLRGRAGLPVDFNLVNELRDICGRIAELVDLFQQADTVLNETLQEALSRDALSLAPEGQAANDGAD